MGSGATKAPDRRTPAPGTARSRALITGGHIPRSWFREHIWKPAFEGDGDTEQAP